MGHHSRLALNFIFVLQPCLSTWKYWQHSISAWNYNWDHHKYHYIKCNQNFHYQQYYHHNHHFIITSEASFWPSVIVIACICMCCVLVNLELVCVVTHHLFNLGSPNLVQRGKRFWLRSLLYCWAIELDLHGQIEHKIKKFTPFWVVHAILPNQLKLGFPNLNQKCILALLWSLLIIFYQTYLHYFCIIFSESIGWKYLVRSSLATDQILAEH